MRYRQAEKAEVIRLVEGSPLSVKQTLAELDVNRSTFYTWYHRYQEHGYDGLANQYHPPKQFWNEIPLNTYTPDLVSTYLSSIFRSELK